MRPNRPITPSASRRDAVLDPERTRGHLSVNDRSVTQGENPLPFLFGQLQPQTPADRVNLLLMQLAIDRPISNCIREFPSDPWGDADPAEICAIGSIQPPLSPPAHTVLWS